MAIHAPASPVRSSNSGSVPSSPVSSDSAARSLSRLHPAQTHISSSSSPLNPAQNNYARSRGSSISTLRDAQLTTAGPASTMAERLGRLASPTLTTDTNSLRRRSKSPGDIDDRIWRKGFRAQGSETPRSGVGDLHASWWGEDMGRRPWWGLSRVQDGMPHEHVEEWKMIRMRVIEASKSVLGSALEVTHEALVLSVDLLELAPVPGLSAAARTLLAIWDNLQLVDLNSVQCMRLVERCADILISVREEVELAGNSVSEELRLPLSRLMDTFEEIEYFLKKQSRRPFIKRYLKRDEMSRQISGCDAGLQQALELFSVSIQIRILKQVQEGLKRQEADSSKLDAILSHSQQSSLGLTFENGGTTPHAGSVRGVDASIPEVPMFESSDTILPKVPVPFSPPSTPSARDTEAPEAAPHLTSADLEPSASSSRDVLPTLLALEAKQNELDAAQDLAHLRDRLRAALASGNDVDMVSILNVGKEDMAEAIKTMQRALERMIELEANEDEWEKVAAAREALEDAKVRAEESQQEREREKVLTTPRRLGQMMKRLSYRGSPGPSPSTSPKTSSLQRSKTVTSSSHTTGSTASTDTTGRRRLKGDTLDREFIEGSIDALRRMSRGTPQATLSLPAWTITRYEVDREKKVGVGFFSDVYKGAWRGKTVAVKVLAETTPRNLFIREVEIWKELRHPHILELYGASSTTGDPPWFFVSPFMKNGSLSDYLRRSAEKLAGSRIRAASSPIGLGASTAITSMSSIITGKERGSSFSAIGRSSRAASITEVGAGAAGSSGREFDLMRFMSEIAKGMHYLHEHGVLHGDLKASNVLVDDRIRCVITDFGQSEMKSEAYRISGTQPPHGTARWQAPELMIGFTEATMAMDVWAFAITCSEILSMGRMPWPLLDDDGVRDRVLRHLEGESPLHLHRPDTPPSRYNTPGLQQLLNACWADEPLERPSFAEIVPQLVQQRKTLRCSTDEVNTPQIPSVVEFDHLISRPSPPMAPSPLPHMSPREPGFIVPGILPESPSTETEDVEPPPVPHPPSAPAQPEPLPVGGMLMPEPNPYQPPLTAGQSRESSVFTSTPHNRSWEDVGQTTSTDQESIAPPPPADESTAAVRHERRYRMLLTHEFHPSLTLPLWTPSLVQLGAVGYLSKPKGQFVTLFNAFSPEDSDDPNVRLLRSVRKYGNLSQGSQRRDRKSARKRGMDAIAGVLKFKNKSDARNQTITKRATFALRAGHKAACLYTEASVYHYVENLEASKKWFKAHVDSILSLYGLQHRIQKEDLFLVIGTLNAEDYALFVSHSHPDGQVHFNVYSSPQSGKPWGTFTTDNEVASVVGGPSYSDEQMPADSVNASKVSRWNMGWDSVLLARLRFKPDVAEPTSL